jgi:hypothetical protein
MESDTVEAPGGDTARWDRHHVVGVLRILPFRQGVREDGRLDVSAATRLTMKRVDLLGPVDPGDAAAQIERLEADEN